MNIVICMITCIWYDSWSHTGWSCVWRNMIMLCQEEISHKCFIWKSHNQSYVVNNAFLLVQLWDHSRLVGLSFRAKGSPLNNNHFSMIDGEWKSLILNKRLYLGTWYKVRGPYSWLRIVREGRKTKEKRLLLLLLLTWFMHNTKVVQNFDRQFHYQFKALVRVKNSIHAFERSLFQNIQSCCIWLHVVYSFNDFSSKIQELWHLGFTQISHWLGLPGS